ncbi:hypothetical protein [Bremerella sp. P1]|uniref:hypothetical protein n=1 Tax=Bremerella sp. P1 TaxID=3026424 RepID=UPI0023683828|nr:hypothetical protein [Bremerella sp. P1]WDI43724.1 hypothetical protein PSR63_07160 [Bremerella sp. P1]
MVHVAWPTTLFAGLVLFAVAGCDKAPDAAPQPEAAISSRTGPEERPISYRERLGRLKYERDQLVRSVNRLGRDREQAIKRLHSLGISSSTDLNSHPDAKYDAQELTQIVGQIQQLKGVISDYDSAIHRVEAVVRRQERKARWEMSAPSESELDQLSAAFREAEEELRPQREFSLVEDLRMEQVLDSELAHDQESDSNSEK